jgi:phospholipid/cholesterol/gamma-HCH transport system substrate-binding protein
MKLEVKIGVFVFLGLLSLFILSMQINSFSNLGVDNKYPIYAYIDDATGLRKNARVKMIGVNVGQVVSKHLEGDKVKLELMINNDVKIPANSLLSLSQDSMLGEKYVKIIPLKSEQFIQKNGVIKKYQKVASFNEAIDSINSAAQEFKNVALKLNQTIDENTTKNIQLIVENFKESTILLKKMLNENRDSLKGTVNGANTMLATINEKLPKIMENVEFLTSEFKKTGTIVNGKLPQIMAHLDELTYQFKETGKSINKKLPILMTKLEKIEDNTTSILEENKDGLKNAISSADEFFGTGAKTFNKLDDYFSSLQQTELDVEIGSYYMMNDNYMQTRGEIAYRPKPDKYYIMGITATNDWSDPSQFNAKHQKTKTYLTAELGKRYNNLLLRGGLIESTGGVGVDYFMYNDKLRVKTDLYDFNAVNDVRGDNAHLRVEARYLTLQHLNFYAGVDNILNKDSLNLFLGVGIGFKDDDLKTILGSSGGSLLK